MLLRKQTRIFFMLFTNSKQACSLISITSSSSTKRLSISKKIYYSAQANLMANRANGKNWNLCWEKTLMEWRHDSDTVSVWIEQPTRVEQNWELAVKVFSLPLHEWPDHDVISIIVLCASLLHFLLLLCNELWHLEWFVFHHDFIVLGSLLFCRHP